MIACQTLICDLYPPSLLKKLTPHRKLARRQSVITRAKMRQVQVTNKQPHVYKPRAKNTTKKLDKQPVKEL